MSYFASGDCVLCSKPAWHAVYQIVRSYDQRLKASRMLLRMVRMLAEAGRRAMRIFEIGPRIAEALGSWSPAEISHAAALLALGGIGPDVISPLAEKIIADLEADKHRLQIAYNIGSSFRHPLCGCGRVPFIMKEIAYIIGSSVLHPLARTGPVDAEGNSRRSHPGIEDGDLMCTR